jgi:hypothetical protein
VHSRRGNSAIGATFRLRYDDGDAVARKAVSIPITVPHPRAASPDGFNSGSRRDGDVRAALDQFGDVPIGLLKVHQIGAWRASLPAGKRYRSHRALRPGAAGRGALALDRGETRRPW